MKTRYENGEEVPAINVKIRHHIGLPSDLDHADEQLREYAFNTVQENWWNEVLPTLVKKCLGKAFKGWRPSAQPAGRSNGWVVVFGLDSPDEWNKTQNSAWDRFEKAIKKSMKDAEEEYVEEVRSRLENP